MADRPIIFSAPMVRALLDGRKTMTRRLAWGEPRDPSTGRIADSYQRPTPWQKAVPGDRLYVRESFQIPALCGVQYRATATERIGHWDPKTGPWRPSIHMPRWASRLTLVVTATKVECLEAISGTDAIAEGLASLGRDGENWHWDPAAKYGDGYFAPWRAFKALWESLHGPASWDARPVVALTFTVHKANIDQMKEAA